MTPAEFSAGLDQSIVVYISEDTGSEVDPAAMYEEIAQDAAARAQKGQRIVSMAAVPTRHAQGFVAREGSGYETKFAVAVVYAPA
ncbi:MAG: hypothetical protein ACHQ15_06310 [Candidatus Limnocylindrales bacterium]